MDRVAKITDKEINDNKARFKIIFEEFLLCIIMVMSEEQLLP